MVVEDDPVISEIICDLLELGGYDTVCAGSGEDAVELAGSAMPDLILLDIVLPGIDGIEVCRRLKGNPLTGRISVVMMTAGSDPGDMARSLECGADDYITKPFNAMKFIDRISAALNQPPLPAENPPRHPSTPGRQAGSRGCR